MAQNTREKIIRQAIACIAQNPNASLEDIAEAAGVGRATIYRHFNSRNDLSVELKITAGKRLTDTVAPILESGLSALEKLASIVEKCIPLGASLHVISYFNLVCKEDDPRVMEIYEKHLEQMRQLETELKSQDAVHQDIPQAWIMASLESLVFAAWEKIESGDIAPNAAPGLVLGTCLSGLGTTRALDWIKQHKE
ncbi:TetR/AcrR family transcriptional regulator [Desulfospira joergensenii]|uniref:TetR/AcrR family transcriptional regulator n=1 Tax=Desulfospira joergensenii TaxID=53329 RepID=UPI00040CAE90|nr:TetR/AcrR family transcriptional regulator [Desulfospira joergensenii]